MSKARNTIMALASIVLILAACQPVGLSPAPAKPTAVSSATEIIPASTPTVLPTPLPSPTPTLVPVSDFMKGVWFADWGLGPGVYTKDGTTVLKDIILPLGANWIAIQSECLLNFQQPSKMDCTAGDSSLSNGEITIAVQIAHSLGFRVAFLPTILTVQNEPDASDTWSGDMDFGSNQKAWSDYFGAYTQNILHFSKLAEQDHVDLLMIGGEQNYAQKQEVYWRTMISQIREIYHGPLTYEAIGNSLSSVKWWDAVDYIGWNAYFTFSNSTHPSYDEVRNNWVALFNSAKSETNKWNKPLIITEIGYQSLKGVAEYGPTGVTPEQLDVEGQGVIYHGIIDALNEVGKGQWPQGMFWYDYNSNPLQGGMGDVNYTPHDKPAETYLRAFYANQPVTPLPTPTPQVEESQIATSYWLFDGQLENGVTLGNAGQSVVSDPLTERGNAIAVKDINYWGGLQLTFPALINLSNWDYLDLYLYVPKYEPNLEMRFDNSNGGRLYIRSYIDHEPLLDDHWHRIEIPLALLFPAGKNISPTYTSNIYFLHMWPGQPGPITFYMTDIRLIKLSK